MFCKAVRSSLKRTPQLLPLSSCNVFGYVFFLILPSFRIFSKEKPEIMLLKNRCQTNNYLIEPNYRFFTLNF